MFTYDAPVVLIIDGDPITLMGTAAVLNMEGCEVHCARDESAVLKAAQSLALDLVLAEVDFSGKPDGGFDLCGRICQEFGHRDVPAIFVSNREIPEIVQKAHDAGATYYLRKPFDPDVLIELVGKAVWLPHVVQNRVAASGVETPRPHRPNVTRNRTTNPR